MPKRIPQSYMPNNGQQRYLISKQTFDAIHEYQQQLGQGKVEPGVNVRAALNYLLAEGNDEFDPNKAFTPEDLEKIRKLSTEEFAQILMNSRKNWIFAEQVRIGDGQAWNEAEFKILSCIGSVVENATVYDNGRHSNPQIQGDGRYADNPHKVHLLCIPGAVLANPIDADRIVDTQPDGSKAINQEKYNDVYVDRLEMMFMQANELGKQEGRKTLVTVPGIGNGVFAGAFKGKTMPNLEKAIATILEAHPEWEHIGCVWLDGWQSPHINDQRIGNTLLRARNSGGNNGDHHLHSGQPYSELGQLSKAEEFAESAEELEEFKNYGRCKVFAWDPFSFEGNDWVAGSRQTDEGCIAATNAHEIISGIEGEYKPVPGRERERAFQPKGFPTWNDAFNEVNLKQSIADRMVVYKDNALVNSKEVSTTQQDLHLKISEIKKGGSFIRDNYPKEQWPAIAKYIVDYKAAIIENLPQRISVRFSKELEAMVKEATILDKKTLMSISHGYNHGDNNRTRYHWRAASANGLRNDLAELRGDALKRKIVEEYREKIASCTTKEELDEVRRDYESSNDKTIIESAQGLWTKTFGRETSSQKAMSEMFQEAEKRVNDFEAGYKSGMEAS
ncbi:hypothetical protein Lbir_2394 [Legionella birminghamensis]|uniref:Substrate of the Dot/Icm secretion system n=1 Tax=Legionella birminghamensis TaxID=28083 RepID=A0A378ID93_9GAMM|nr:hypothetical protein [Legionella birminghamensis]KTC68861.1 hypothetical protein Lbir_2394 [Legionella birminghamensis]STX33197.1 substrate of the Dot/Icm secretion system [Legionella birminghamensis]